ncbi:hypothetical protein COW49_02570, partial [Candidatus Kaiserbacteria bacterium CG17_big_fil_post_rev_8_21_14_2_50_51_7]
MIIISTIIMIEIRAPHDCAFGEGIDGGEELLRSGSMRVRVYQNKAASVASKSSATIFVILIIGLIAGPAV